MVIKDDFVGSAMLLVCLLLTPARQALHYGLQQYARRAGRPQLTWIKLMTDQLKSINFTW